MRSHTAIRGLCDEYGFDHFADALLRRRRRLLAFLAPNPTRQLAGLIEADEKFFRTFSRDRAHGSVGKAAIQ